MILAMRVALYEGSWEKYHKGTDFATEDNSEEFFKEVMNWGDQYLIPGRTDFAYDSNQSESYQYR